MPKTKQRKPKPDYPTIEFPLAIEEVDLKGDMECGFRQSWIDAENDEIKIELLSGAGLGSQWLLIHVTDRDSGSEKRFRADMGKFLKQFARRITEKATD